MILSNSFVVLEDPVPAKPMLRFFDRAGRRTTDQRIRAFDVESGEELWHHRLPRAGIATPMTYEHDGRQYVVIAAGGHGRWGLAVGDYVVAFALPDN